MHVFEMVLGIVFIVFVANVLIKYFDSKKHSQKNTGASKHDQARMAALEKRVQVLERIVTDKKYDLHREFDELKSMDG